MELTPEKLVQVAPAHRSILNPVSLLALSVHVRFTLPLDTITALRPLGAMGIVDTVGVGVGVDVDIG